jgi:hypothetical protein
MTEFYLPHEKLNAYQEARKLPRLRSRSQHFGDQASGSGDAGGDQRLPEHRGGSWADGARGQGSRLLHCAR